MDNFKKMLPTLLLITAAIFLFQFFTNKPEDKSSDGGQDDVASKYTKAVAALRIASDDSKIETVTLGSLNKEDGYKFQIQLSNEQAGVEQILLSEYFQTAEDTRLYNSDPAKYEENRKKDPKTFKGHYALIKPVNLSTERLLAFATKHITLETPERDNKTVKYSSLIREVKTENNKPFLTRRNKFIWRSKGVKTDEKAGTQSAIFELPIENIERVERFTIRKTYTITKDSYSIGLKVEFINKLAVPVKVDFIQDATTGVMRESEKTDERKVACGLLDDDDEIEVNQKNDAGKLEDATLGEWDSLGNSGSKEDAALWIGETNKFFGSMVYLKPTSEDRIKASEYNADFKFRAVSDKSKTRSWQSAIEISEIQLAAAKSPDAPETATIEFDIFAGPKLRNMLTKDGSLYNKIGYGETLSGGACFMQIPFLTTALMWLLGFFGKLFSNYGIAIMLLVLMVRLVLHPLAKKSQINMALAQKKMAALAPKIEKIKEQFKDDKQRASMEQMKLTREAGVFKGQMMGCLPMLLQMPIWISLFRGLNTEVILRHAAFLPVWITDLASPDALFSFGTDLWLIGPSFNLLPILLAVAMYFQSKSNPSMNQAAATPEQQQQQKMMKVMMPLMMLVFFYKMPSGLTLYIMASTAIGAYEQRRIRKHIKEHQEILDQEMASEVVVSAPGKGSRDSRPKKPKGPNWVKKP